MKVEIFSDIACPWCYIGKTRFERALASYEHRDAVQVVWRSFQLDPDAPQREPGSTVDHLAHKYGISRDRALAMMDGASQVAAEEGLEFHLDRALTANTFDAHRVAHLAAAMGKGREVMERLMRAYQAEGANVADHDTLVELAAAAGLDEREVRQALESGAYADAVEADLDRAAAYGVTGVPFFVFDQTHGASGAQPTEFFLAALRQLGPRADRADAPGERGPGGREEAGRGITSG
ncbi:MAG TPA: DsbA family oxidoreductase [Trueperaceae bacterium]